jgi:hypothetical protein
MTAGWGGAVGGARGGGSSHLLASSLSRGRLQAGLAGRGWSLGIFGRKMLRGTRQAIFGRTRQAR